MLDYRDLFQSKNQYMIDSSTNFKTEIPIIINLINKYSDISFDWSDIKYTDKLSEEELIKIQNTVANKIQSELVTIFSPYIKPHLTKLFGKDLKYNIRVSAQVKSRWPEKIGNENRKGFFVDGVFAEDKKKPNIAFPTRAHQDLDNNGNRGSHTMIFYFQLTEAVKESSSLEFGEFPNQIGILPFSSEWGYPNEIDYNIQQIMKWKVPDLQPGNVTLMSGLTPHRSSKLGKIPRVALNVKIQPSNLTYLDNIYSTSFVKLKEVNTISNKLSILKDIIAPLTKSNRLLLYELAVTNYLLRDFKTAKDNLRDLCLFDIEEDLLDKWLLASIVKKVMYHITDEELSKSYDPIKEIVPMSSGDAIMQTIYLHS